MYSYHRQEALVEESPTYKNLQKNMTEEILSQIEVAVLFWIYRSLQ